MIKMMDQKQVVKQMSELQKTALNSSFNAAEIVQTRMEKIIRMLWEQAAWTSEKWGNAMLDWTRVYQESFDNVKETMESNLAQFGCYDLSKRN